MILLFSIISDVERAQSYNAKLQAMNREFDAHLDAVERETDAVRKEIKARQKKQGE